MAKLAGSVVRSLGHNAPWQTFNGKFVAYTDIGDYTGTYIFFFVSTPPPGPCIIRQTSFEPLFNTLWYDRVFGYASKWNNIENSFFHRPVKNFPRENGILSYSPCIPYVIPLSKGTVVYLRCF